MRLKNKIFLLMESMLAHFTDRIVCISEAERDSAIYNNVCGEEKLALIPNGIDIGAVKSALPIKRSELGIAEDAFVVGMIGRLSAQKAPDVFIRAAEKNVVATRIDAIPTLIEDGVDGLLVDADNPQQAAAKVLWIYHHPQEAAAIRARALRKVYTNFDINRVINQHMAMFDELMGGQDLTLPSLSCHYPSNLKKGGRHEDIIYRWSWIYRLQSH